MIAQPADAAQTEAVDAPLESCLLILGAAGTGKSSALARRVERIVREHGPASVFVAGHPEKIVELARVALEARGTAFALIDDIEAQARFAHAAKPLFALEWDEFAAGAIDPEVPGLRSPERFLLSAFRLFRKLRDAALEPAEFLERSLAGAARFYAKPPNFASPELIRATKDAYRNSLDVTPEELHRQYRREVDLAKILARLYESYTSILERSGALTARDAIARAAAELARDPSVASAMRERFRFVCIDEAQDLTPAAIALLEAAYGEARCGITLAGDPGSATNTFRGARPDLAFAQRFARITLTAAHRSPPAIDLASRRLCGEAYGVAPAMTPSVSLFRAASQHDEARFVAARVRSELDAGTAADEIALVFRSVCDVDVYERALLERDVPVMISGDRNIFNDRRVLDALALLWNLWDPFRHDWMLRTLGGRAFALSDFTLAALCSEPPGAQTALFAYDIENAPTTRSSRWDPKRDLRLGWNVVRGEADASLSPAALERVRLFRTMRESWLEAMNVLTFGELARRVWADALAGDGAPGSARERSQRQLLEQLLRRLEGYAAQRSDATLGDILAYAGERAASDLEACEDASARGFVRLLSVDAAQGRQFSLVILPDARAGSFPRWYVPDSFLFSPKLGMVPKENVGDATSARTAKFSYYIESAKTKERYNDEERRAFVYAMRRATRELVVTAYGSATRGTTAPEFLEELRNARLPGTNVVA